MYIVAYRTPNPTLQNAIAYHGRPRSPDAVTMTATSRDVAAAVATSPDVVAFDTDAGNHLMKPSRRRQFCNNAARLGGRRGLPARPGRRRDETGLSGRRRCRRGCAVRQ